MVSSECTCLFHFHIKAGGSGSGTGKRRGGGGFVPGTEKDLNENTQKVTETKKTSGKRIYPRDQFVEADNCVQDH